MKSYNSSKGYAIATVFIFSALLCLTAAALLRYSGTEFRLNQRNQLRFQAKNASEAMLEYGASELMARLQLKQNFTTAELTTNKLQIQNARKSTLFATGAGTYNNVDASSLNLWASQYTDPIDRIIDPKDPGNAFDPLSGQKVRAISIRLLSTATASAPNLSETQYATQSVEIRDIYLFNYAIFYNIRMEFHPGADMVVNGPVHSNQDMYLTTDYSIKFLSPVTTAGLFYATGYASGRSSTQSSIFFTTKAENPDPTLDMVSITSSSIKDRNNTANSLNTYVDSTLLSRKAGNTFSDVASNTWGGNLKDSSMGILGQSPPAISAGDSAAAHKLIEPPDISTGANANVEAQKFSNKAGLYILQGAPVSGVAPDPIAFTNSLDAAEYKSKTTVAARTTWLSDAANKSKVVVLPTGVLKNTRRLKDFRENSNVNIVDLDVGKLRTAVAASSSSTNIKKYNSATSSYDTDLDLDSSVTRNGSTDMNWNGQVYVDIENPLTGFNSTSDVTASGSGNGSRTAVRLVNGSQVPNRKDAAGSAATAVDGFTVATNAPIYVLGDLNSPGINNGQRLNSSGVATNVGTETDATIGSPKIGESPVAIAADAINILSNAWWDGSTPIGDGTSDNSTRPPASKTEISAAFLTGNVESASSGEYSGGVENFPRFLEAWGNSTKFRYRGSMVALFNSTVATGRWSAAKYGAPGRQWGFNTMFKTGRQPPGTPMLRTYRRISYGDLTAAQFNAFLSSTAPNYHFQVQ